MCTGFRVGYSEISAFYNETVGIFIPFTYLYIFDFSLLSLSMLLRDMVALWDKKLGCKVVRGPSPSGPLGGGKKYVVRSWGHFGPSLLVLLMFCVSVIADSFNWIRGRKSLTLLPCSLSS